MTERYTPTEWKNKIVDSDGTVVQEGTPLSAENLNHIEQMVAFLANALGIADGIATLNGDGVVPSEQLPSNLREMRVVHDMAARDALETFEGLRVLVTDATADETVKIGWAEYVFDGTAFKKVAEGEQLDITLTWDDIQGKPTAFVPVYHEHTEANIKDLDKYTKQEINDLLAQKASKQYVSETKDGILSATDFATMAAAVRNVATLISHVSKNDNPHGVTKTQIGLGNVENYAVANQLQAETGAANNLYMTPLRVAQAIAVLVPDALSGFTNDAGFISSNASKITVGNTAPTNPNVNDIWIVT